MKKILLSLFVGLIGIISFCSAGSITYSGSMENGVNIYVPYNSTITQGGNPNITVSCTVKPTQIGRQVHPQLYFYDGTRIDYTTITLNSLDGYSFTYDSKKQVVRVNFDAYTPGAPLLYTCTFDGLNILGACDCPVCDDPYTSLECQTEYNLIPVEDIDINYCVGNGLCPNESGTGDFSGDLQFSNIYINNVLHPGRQNIFLTIPDYITWDYAFTGDDFNIYVGSGYDEEYINSIIKINSYRPTTTDFSDIFISGLTLIFPYIVVTLFIIFVWRLLKRIFR